MSKFTNNIARNTREEMLDPVFLKRVLGQLKGLTGRVYWVMESGAADYTNFCDEHPDYDDGDPAVYTSLQDAIDACTNDRGDVIIVDQQYTETLTAQIDADKSGIKIIGLGQGRLKPTITGNGTIDCFDVSAANVTIENIHFAAPETDAQTSFINVDAAGCTLKNISGVGSQSGKNVVDCITITANADNLTINGVEFFNRTVAVNSFLSLEGAAKSVTVKNFYAFGDVATAGIIDGAKIDYLVLENVNVGVVGATKPAATLDSNPEGIAIRCNFAGTHGTLATNGNLGNLMRSFEVRVLEETDNSAQGALTPAVDVD